MERRRRTLLASVAVAGALVVPAVLVVDPGVASAAACSTSSGAATCTVNTSVTITAGTLAVESPGTLYWSFVLNGYDQWASGSATALSGCSAGSSGTTCSGGSSPELEILDDTGAGAGWALSEYLTSSDLPTGAVFHFDGAGSATTGVSQSNPIGTDPFSATTPGAVCDNGSTCTLPTAAASCSHAGLGFTSCPTYPVDLTSGTASNAQADLYSAQAGTGKGAICFGSGSSSAVGCSGVSFDDDYNLGIPASTSASTYATTVINLTISAGP